MIDRGILHHSYSSTRGDLSKGAKSRIFCCVQVVDNHLMNAVTKAGERYTTRVRAPVGDLNTIANVADGNAANGTAESLSMISRVQAGASNERRDRK